MKTSPNLDMRWPMLGPVFVRLPGVAGVLLSHNASILRITATEFPTWVFTGLLGRTVTLGRHCMSLPGVRNFRVGRYYLGVL